MSKFILVVQSNATGGADDEYNDWYNNTHIGEVLQLNGFTAAQRFTAKGDPVAGSSSHRYLAIYEMETDDPQAVLDSLSAAVGDGTIHMSDAIDTNGVSAVLFEPISARVVGPQ
ncbi:MAG: hypothetical protein O7B25_07545 [Gammaproteobacteria bacterium]|nr:hypothetical protein [Gammaproteobacteria bacterium]